MPLAMLKPILLALLAVMASPTVAAVEVSFYWHEGHGMFPHAFVLTRGSMDAFPDHPVAYNYGFTAKTLTPAILMGPVGGKVEAAEGRYVAQGVEAFRVTLSDEQYRTFAATVRKWRDLSPPAYDLEKRNCIHFVADLARAIGLKADAPGALVKKPRLYLERVKALNPGTVR